ncbi:MAG: hypothetical protein AAGA92_13165 [Planctomycetota bacterium]
MKSEHRHELETNELAHWLEVTIERAKPYTGYILAGIAAAVIAVLATSFAGGRSAEKEEQAWEAFALASYSRELDLASLQEVAVSDDYAGSDVQEWAYLTWADRQVQLGAQSYLDNRERATELLKLSVSAYESVASLSKDQQLVDRARLGLARVYEMQNQPDRARQEYELVQGDFTDVAAAALRRLEDSAAEEDLAWLATSALPRPPVSESGVLGSDPTFGVDIPGVSEEQQAEQKSLEQILGGFLPNGAANRYGEEDAAVEEGEAAEAEAEEGSEEGPAETDAADAAEEAASDEASETAEP